MTEHTDKHAMYVCICSVLRRMCVTVFACIDGFIAFRSDWDMLLFQFFFLAFFVCRLSVYVRVLVLCCADSYIGQDYYLVRTV